MSDIVNNQDSFTRSAGRQLLLFGLASAAGVVLLMLGLSWASSLTGTGAAGGDAVDAATSTITLALSTEPPQLDSTKTTDQVSGRILGHVMEGLLRYDKHNDIAPGVAERWRINGTEATFRLRPDARWSDGKPVTAHDFVFAWRKAVEPATGSEYAFILYPVKNGEAINEGKMPPSALGARAVDDRTLEVTLERPIPYFDKLVAFGPTTPSARTSTSPPTAATGPTPIRCSTTARSGSPAGCTARACAWRKTPTTGTRTAST